MKLVIVLLEIRSGFPGFSGHYAEGIASIAASVKAAGHTFELIHLTQPTPSDAVVARIAATGADLVGFSCMTNTAPYLELYAPALRRALPGLPIVAGGVHPTLQPEDCLAIDGIDGVCIGEGERVAVEALDRLQQGHGLHDIPGLWLEHDGEIERNTPCLAAGSLDELPPPDRGVFDFANLMTSREGVLYVHASRGCPYRCRFCCNAALRERWPRGGKYLRYKSVERLCDEIEAAVAHFPGTLHGIYFQDEILGLDKRWLAAFAEAYPKRIGVPFNCNLRADNVTPEVVDWLARAGCRSVSIGLESGSERIRTTVLGKTISDRQFETAFRQLDDAGIRVATFSMVGLPDETLDDALATVRMNADRRVDRRMISIFFPFPGTGLHADVVANGLLSSRRPDTYQETTPLDQASISRRQVEFIHDFFGPLVALAGQGRGGSMQRLVWALLRRDSRLLDVLVQLQRRLRRLAVPVYLATAGRLGSRQAKVFASQPARPATALRHASSQT